MPRPTHDPLTDGQVRRFAPSTTPIDLRDGETRGLILTVLPSDRKQWTVRYRKHGKQRRLVLGEYPGLSLAQARKRARHEQTKLDADADYDPAAEHQEAKLARTDTVTALVEEYLDEHARKFKRTAEEDERMLKVDVLPYWGDRSVRDITRQDVKALLKRIVKRGSPIAANRTLAVIRKMLNYAVDEQWLDANPAARVKKPAPEVSRDRVLSDDEIRRIWRVLSNLPATTDKPAPGRKRAQGAKDDPLCPISARLAALLKVRTLTAQRGGEVARMRWADSDLDSGWWNIPGTDTKNKLAHRVPLVPEAVEIIRAFQPKDDDEDAERELVFVGRGKSIRDRAKKAPAAIARVLDGMDFRGHDLRRTAATRMAEAGIPREHISRVLNHVEGGPRATHVYNRYEYDREKRIALETWARVLTRILENKPAANVVPMARA